jgi:hypothetical protein
MDTRSRLSYEDDIQDRENEKYNTERNRQVEKQALNSSSGVIASTTHIATTKSSQSSPPALENDYNNQGD